MKLVFVPDPVLTSLAKPVTQFDTKLKKTVKEMIALLDTQTDPPGVGLAAPQVGLPLQLFVVKLSRRDVPFVCINPEIKEIKDVKKKSPKKENGIKLEGCLSIYGIWGPVKRHAKVFLKYQDVEGTTHEEWFSGFRATVIQHEVDHLTGILFTQRVLEQKGTLYKEEHGELHKIDNLI